MNQYFGKYRGKVENNVDPMQMGRVQFSCPSVLGDGTLSWAMPCVPFAGKGVGFFMIPPNKSNLWIEFEAGDPNRPIWAGGFWDLGEVPALPAVAEMKVIKTDTCTLTLSDLPGIGGIKIETKTGMKIELTATSLKITNGLNATIEMTGPKVSVNSGALEVT